MNAYCADSERFPDRDFLSELRQYHNSPQLGSKWEKDTLLDEPITTSQHISPLFENIYLRYFIIPVCLDKTRGGHQIPAKSISHSSNITIRAQIIKTHAMMLELPLLVRSGSFFIFSLTCARAEGVSFRCALICGNFRRLSARFNYPSFCGSKTRVLRRLILCSPLFVLAELGPKIPNQPWSSRGYFLDVLLETG